MKSITLKKLSLKDGKMEGGFASLSLTQIEKIKGGSGGCGCNNCQCWGNNCQCNGNNCQCC